MVNSTSTGLTFLTGLRGSRHHLKYIKSGVEQVYYVKCMLMSSDQWEQCQRPQLYPFSTTLNTFLYSPMGSWHGSSLQHLKHHLASPSSGSGASGVKSEICLSGMGSVLRWILWIFCTNFSGDVYWNGLYLYPEWTRDWVGDCNMYNLQYQFEGWTFEMGG